MVLVASKEMKRYFETLQADADRCYTVAREARERGMDPELEVEIPQAQDLASRVEKLLELDGVADLIRRTAKDRDREEMSIHVAKQVANQLKASKSVALDKAVRVGLAVLTEGILVAPLDGIAEVKVCGSGKDSYTSISFAGPIRSAGGTGQAMSVLIADVVRRELGIGAYKATKEEIERWKEEIPLYRQVQHLQYQPPEKEVELAVGGCPVCIDGEGTEEAEISGYRDLPRIETNRVRGGACLVMAEGLCLKASKVQKHVQKLGIDGWEFIDDVVKLKGKGEDDDGATKIEPSEKFIKDLVAGRPVYSHPSRKGGFRLRYGRSRTAGLASLSIHPATMYIFEETMAIGTQIKIERPGKAGISTPCDELEGPLVLMKNNDVVRIDSVEEAKARLPEIKEIIELGEVLIPVGEFLENNHPLVPGVFDIGWFMAELTKAGIKDTSKYETATLKESVKLAREKDVPLHPAYTFLWNNLSVGQVNALRKMLVNEGKVKNDVLKLSDCEEMREILIELAVPHVLDGDDDLKIEAGKAVAASLGLEIKKGTLKPREYEHDGKGDTLAFVSALAGFRIGNKCGTLIGARMARPEKANKRMMNPPVHGLFPVGKAGGPQRLLNKAESASKLKLDVDHRTCKDCGSNGYLTLCDCGGHTVSKQRYESQEVDVYKVLRDAKRRLKIHDMPKVKGVQGMISKNKTPEMADKGILRSKHGVFVFKDGTARFDCTDAPLTHFRPREVGTGIAELLKMGYTKDVEGKNLENEDQLLELKIQDIILPEKGGDYLLNVANFIDELLTSFYHVEPYYKAKSRRDLIGVSLLGLSPHTSGGVLARLVGYTRACVGYAHPFFHAAKRRNCFAPDTSIWVKSELGWELLQIKQIVEKRLGSMNIKQDDYGTCYKEENELFVPSISTSGNQSIKAISSVSKHLAPRHMIELKTRSGRNITVTPEHKMLKKGKGLEFHQAHTLKVGDLLPSPKKLEIEGKKIQIDLLKELMSDGGSIWFDEIVERNIIKNIHKYVYSLTVEDNHTLVANDLYTGQCDGDEDCFMLLLDGLLNFSVSFLPEKRGGRMDAPLVLMTRIDPNEIDKEAHNIDVMSSYPIELYEATLKNANPKSIEGLLDTVGSRIGSVLQYEDFGFTLDTGDIAAGPTVSAYKTLGSMAEKTDLQLSLARRIRAVDEKDVAERLLGNHFIPDMIGNLKKFSSQKLRCTKCGSKFRRMPLSGQCTCGHKLILTVHEASVRKYLEMSKAIARDFDVSPYVSQRIDLLERAMGSMFENDKVKNCTLGDFF